MESKKWNILYFISEGYLIFHVLSMCCCSIAAFKQEYCVGEGFKPQCSNNAVIVMEHALYGRMKQGRCLTSNSNLGCQTDVLPQLDILCSNKNECDINNFYSDFTITDETCLDMIRYLEADFTCKQVLQIEHSACTSSPTFEVSPSISISSETLAKSLCGSASIIFSTRPGQQLNVTITDFNPNQHNNGQSCVNYLEITDVTTKERRTVCAGSYGRQGQVMLTSGKEANVVFHVLDPNVQRFLLTFEAVGCGDIPPPDGIWVRRDGDRTTLGCKVGQHSWILKCEHNQWVGAVGSCGTGLSVRQPDTVDAETAAWDIAPALLVFAFCCCMLLMCSTVFSVGVCIYSKSNQKPRQSIPVIYKANSSHQQTLPLMVHRRPDVVQHNIPHNVLLHSLPSTSSGQYDSRSFKKQTSVDLDTDLYYDKTTRSQTESLYSDSVKYYVLENPNEVHQQETMPLRDNTNE